MKAQGSISSPISSLVLLVLIALFSTAYAVPRATVPANSITLEATAKSVGKKGNLKVTDFTLEGELQSVTLDMEQFDVWAPNAVFIVNGKTRPAPKTVYFKGTVDGDPGSTAILSVRGTGGVNGFVTKSGNAWAIGKSPAPGQIKSKKADFENYTRAPFSCGQDTLSHVHAPINTTLASRKLLFDRTLLQSQSVLDQQYRATIALETDYQYYTKFNNVDLAADYAGDLVGYTDLIYSREVRTDIVIGFFRLWTTDSDPYPTTTSSSTALNNFRNYWNNNMGYVQRTIAHQLSGMETGGGIAYVGVLCNNLYGYGHSGTLDANFNWNGDQLSNPAAVVWDIMVFAHEIGHNFNSGHSHEYCGIGGVADSVDHCYGSNTCGAATGLPSCTGPTPYFKGGRGTIMSYCHLVSGGMSNMAMTFGGTAALPHTCGVAPTRVADRMRAHVASRASSNPSCFQISTCGNELIEGSEQCDSTALGGNTCLSLGFVGGGSLSCSSTCAFDTSACIESTAVCGDGVVENTEVCDGTNFNGATCQTLGFDDGTLTCSTACNSIDTGGCFNVPTCGDNLKEGQEQCDGTDLGLATCATEGFTGGQLSCSTSCLYDTSSCTTCGNGLKEGTEGCDGTDLGTSTCSTEGFEGGTLACKLDCSLDTSGCIASAVCGNGVIDGTEVCDGSSLAGKTCALLNYAGGTLSCASTCLSYDTSQCCSSYTMSAIVSRSSYSSGTEVIPPYKTGADRGATCSANCKDNALCNSWSFDTTRKAICYLYLEGDRAEVSRNKNFVLGYKICSP